MLDETVFRSGEVPAADRLAYWAERVGRTHAPVRMTSDHAHDFRATQRILGLGAASVWSATFQQLVIRRTPKPIRRSDPELFHHGGASPGGRLQPRVPHRVRHHADGVPEPGRRRGHVAALLSAS
ncbi:hypothetical protein ACFQ93_40210 [Streptomyces sp. NPDC056601]|uniref:hypothetical protein n=1 Tax=Streptomyces sp. NPDC056601 TaxID=3345875 RepID=UPI00369F7208